MWFLSSLSCSFPSLSVPPCFEAPAVMLGCLTRDTRSFAPFQPHASLVASSQPFPHLSEPFASSHPWNSLSLPPLCNATLLFPRDGWPLLVSLFEPCHCTTCSFSLWLTKGAFDQRVTVCGSQKCDYVVVTFVQGLQRCFDLIAPEAKGPKPFKTSLTCWAHSIRPDQSQILVPG